MRVGMLSQGPLYFPTHICLFVNYISSHKNRLRLIIFIMFTLTAWCNGNKMLINN